MESVSSKRKLIDIKQPVFQLLSQEANERQISLKRLIEDMLDKAARQYEERRRNEMAISPVIRQLIGSAKPAGRAVSEIEDDRLQYILSK